MARTLDQNALSARLEFYREMGIYGLYRRPVDATAVSENPETPDEQYLPKKKEVTVTAEKTLNVLQPTLSKPDGLKAIREDLGDCTRCVLHKQGRKQIVFGVGNPSAELMFVGEGPGADEDEQGIPFIGRAGQLLTNMITNGMGLKREDVYIANVVKCRPPGNRTPEREECDTCSPFLFRQIEVIQPKMIVALGAVAAKTLLGVNEAMARLRGQIYDFSTPRRPGSDLYDGKLVVTYHPAYLLRDPRQKSEAWKDLQIVMRYLGIPMPAKKSAE
ncbi:phage SPO1 DNA polymerase-related protein [Candidatus Koribacter versatilis Ellin345]|uniref:Type-4 uracil-DNA glycosylase n=1 Tax=Koribacter versatilis (strain Ellin345) TaxID=204669 RepID=Q1IK25_KORVE|nr:uracil-DNA glycosylase [Candidatus Koribacter versatilis]ABF42775.1 phage SPO1 DNA polymerase-related protein [Candidatus Koribacter versatilis Ellin345]